MNFFGQASGEKRDYASQLEYWENPDTGLRPPTHPVQVQFAEQRLKYINRFIPLQNIQSALDVGCGNGVGTISLKHWVNMVFGLDISEYLLNQIPDNIISIQGDASGYLYGTRSLIYQWHGN